MLCASHAGGPCAGWLLSTGCWQGLGYLSGYLPAGHPLPPAAPFTLSLMSQQCHCSSQKQAQSLCSPGREPSLGSSWVNFLISLVVHAPTVLCSKDVAPELPSEKPWQPHLSTLYRISGKGSLSTGYYKLQDCQ